MKIQSGENIQVKENLTNRKPWFNGVKIFSSVKVNPPQEPPTLGICVKEKIKTVDQLR